MIRSLWIRKPGLEAQQTRGMNSNNWANGSTTGFKRASRGVRDLLYQTIRQPGAAVVSSRPSCRPACNWVPG